MVMQKCWDGEGGLIVLCERITLQTSVSPKTLPIILEKLDKFKILLLLEW